MVSLILAPSSSLVTEHNPSTLHLCLFVSHPQVWANYDVGIGVVLGCVTDPPEQSKTGYPGGLLFWPWKAKTSCSE